MKRPWKSRIWFYRPQWDWDWYWFKRWGWKLFSRGDDEFMWHTWALGTAWTGQIVIAVRPCPIDGCYTQDELDKLSLSGFDPSSSWPIDSYGWDHSKSNLENAWALPNLYTTPLEVYEDYTNEWNAYHDERCARSRPCPDHIPGTQIS